ncbi:MoaD/ThiS family protein [Luteimicrobium sp. DT211]|uniref:MoaD/ThiS family protein n=1 Tax=Luteimicrobium sp. DT211 TaxID=3393412 RepID=UPI003CF2B888
MTTTDERSAPTEAERLAAGPTVRVRAFAAARAALGWSELDVSARPGSTVGELLTGLLAEAPDAADVIARCSVLVDGIRAEGDAAVSAGAVVDLLPPFAGG